MTRPIVRIGDHDVSNQEEFVRKNYFSEKPIAPQQKFLIRFKRGDKFLRNKRDGSVPLIAWLKIGLRLHTVYGAQQIGQPVAFRRMVHPFVGFPSDRSRLVVIP